MKRTKNLLMGPYPDPLLVLVVHGPDRQPPDDHDMVDVDVSLQGRMPQEEIPDLLRRIAVGVECRLAAGRPS